jgi:predicted Zn-dependent protease
LTIVKQRAGLLFKHKRNEELHDLHAALDKHDEQSAAEPYRALINGYLAELENEPKKALDAYQQIVDGADVLLEEALSRIAGICIDQNDIHMANLSLQCLSQLSPIYLPFYAEMQRLHGDAVEAIDVYGRYIEQFPEDTAIQLKLAMLYIQCKVYDGAEMMLDYILQQKPNLAAALGMKQQLVVIKAKG